jgi:hypothetical protein
MDEKCIAEAILEADISDRCAVFRTTEFSEPDTNTDADLSHFTPDEPPRL